MPPRKAANNTLDIEAENVRIICTRCGFSSHVAAKAKVSDLRTVLYAFRKMHGPERCEAKE